MNEKQFLKELKNLGATKDEAKKAFIGIDEKGFSYKEVLNQFKRYKGGQLRTKAREMAKNRPEILGELRREEYQQLSPRQRAGAGVGRWAASTPGIKQAYELATGDKIQSSDFEAFKEASQGDLATTMGGLVPDIAALSVGGGLASKAKYIKELPKYAKYGLAGLGSGTFHQAQNVQAGRDIDPVEMGVETVGSVALPYGVKGAGSFLRGSGKRIAETAYKAGRAVKGEKTLKPKQLETLMKKYSSFLGAIGSEKIIKKEQNILGKSFEKIWQKSKAKPSQGVRGKWVDPTEAINDAKLQIQRLANAGKIDATKRKDLFKKLGDLEKAMKPLLNEQGEMSLRMAQRFKTNTLDEWADFDKPSQLGIITPGMKSKATASRAVRGKLLKKMVKQEPELKELNKQYSELAGIKPFVEQSAERAKANRFFSPQDIASGAAGLIGGSAGMAYTKTFDPKILLAALVPFAVSRGQKSPVVAKALYKLGQGQMMSEKLFSNLPEGAQRAVIQAMRSTYAGRQ